MLLGFYAEDGDVSPKRDVIPSKFVESALDYIENSSDSYNVENVTTIDRQNEKVSWEQIVFKEEEQKIQKVENNMEIDETLGEVEKLRQDKKDLEEQVKRLTQEVADRDVKIIIGAKKNVAEKPTKEKKEFMYKPKKPFGPRHPKFYQLKGSTDVPDWYEEHEKTWKAYEQEMKRWESWKLTGKIPPQHKVKKAKK